MRNEVELLEDESDMIDTEAVASGKRRELGAEDLDAASLHCQHPHEQRKEGALAAAARTEQENALARVDCEALDVEEGRACGGLAEQEGCDVGQRA